MQIKNYFTIRLYLLNKYGSLTNFVEGFKVDTHGRVYPYLKD
jgi:hypothetical protein